ncbi:MAG: DUF1269 domain-containing protein [Acidimicrobiia bacterium]
MSDSNSTDQAVAGVGMLIGAYTAENGAGDALSALKQAKHDGEFYYDDAAVVSRDSDNKVEVKETGDMSTGKGAGIGALIGGVIGLIGGPAAVALGAGAGAAIGGLAAHADAGFDNETLARIGGALPAGTSALAVTTSKDFIEAVRYAASDADTMSMAEDIAGGIRDSLNAGQDTLTALVLTEDGVAATKVVDGPDSVAAFGIAATEGAATAGAVVATEDGVVAAQTAVVAVDDSDANDSEEA